MATSARVGDTTLKRAHDQPSMEGETDISHCALLSFAPSSTGPAARVASAA